MASLNKVMLIGNLTRDPDVRMLSNGRPVCNFGLALNRNYKDSEGNRKEEVTFVDVECYGPRAEAVGRFFTKGRSIFVEGRLKLDQWESKPSSLYAGRPLENRIRANRSYVETFCGSERKFSSSREQSVLYEERSLAENRCCDESSRSCQIYACCL